MPTERRWREKSKPSLLAAMRANAGDLDHRAFRRKARGAAGAFQRLRDRAAGRFADGAAALADQEHDRIAVGVMAHASDKGVAAFDPMDETVVPQEIEGAIDRDRRWPRPMRQALHDLVGAQRSVTGKERFEHVTAHRRQPLRARRAELFRVRDRGAGAAAVIVVRRRKNHFRFCHRGAMNRRTMLLALHAIVTIYTVLRKGDAASDFRYCAAAKSVSHCRRFAHINSSKALSAAALNWG
jgi:hypothetical protein